ncbi:hypothetical protein [Sphingopyxis chilensis]
MTERDFETLERTADVDRHCDQVAAVGCGVIGRRFAEAVRPQTDMKLIGVADVAAEWRVAQATRAGLSFCGGCRNALGDGGGRA